MVSTQIESNSHFRTNAESHTVSLQIHSSDHIQEATVGLVPDFVA